MSGNWLLNNIFQIGDVRFHLHVDDWHGESLQSIGKSAPIQDSYRVLMPSTRYKYQSTSYKISALLYNDGIYEESQYLQKLKSLEGLETDVIAYRQIGGGANVHQCCQCFCCGCRLMWLHTSGRVVDIKVTAENFRVYRVTIDLEVQPTWIPLNRALFRWNRQGASQTNTEFLTEPFEDQVEDNYPNCDELYNQGDCYYWRRRSILSYGDLYNPELFTYLHQNTDPQTGVATDWKTTSDRVYVTCRPEYWGMAPLSIYVFDMLDSSNGKILIDVRHPINIVNEISRRTEVDITTVKQLAFASGISIVDTDLLVIGNVQDGGFIVRNGEIVVYVAPAIVRNGDDWPGMLEPGRNVVEVYPPVDGRWAMNHTFRSL